MSVFLFNTLLLREASNTRAMKRGLYLYLRAFYLISDLGMEPKLRILQHRI